MTVIARRHDEAIQRDQTVNLNCFTPFAMTQSCNNN